MREMYPKDQESCTFLSLTVTIRSIHAEPNAAGSTEGSILSAAGQGLFIKGLSSSWFCPCSEKILLNKMGTLK
jgi:hypothetical protein